jgi:hypothetical protein
MLANTRHSWILKEDSTTTRMWTTNFNAIWHNLLHSPPTVIEIFKVFTTVQLRILFFWYIKRCQWVTRSQIPRQHGIHLQELPRDAENELLNRSNVIPEKNLILMLFTDI